MTLEAVLREDRPNVPVEIDRGRGIRLCSAHEAAQRDAPHQQAREMKE